MLEIIHEHFLCFDLKSDRFLGEKLFGPDFGLKIEAIDLCDIFRTRSGPLDFYKTKTSPCYILSKHIAAGLLASLWTSLAPPDGLSTAIKVLDGDFSHFWPFRERTQKAHEVPTKMREITT